MQNKTRSGNGSYVVQTIHAACFEDGRQQHIEHELILFTEGTGIAYIGEYEGKFEAGDIYFLGSNLSHTFKNSSNKQLHAIAILFRDNYWGNHFLNIPECTAIKQLLEIAAHGLQVTGNSKYRLQPLIKELETATDINRVILLLQCLQAMSTPKEYIILSKKKVQGKVERELIEKVFEYTLASFHDPITLSKIANIACMSIPSFCHYFKRCSNKTYIDYLNEVRISYACRQLQETNKSVTEICYESGYNTIVHFHRQFFRLKKITPLQFRKKFSELQNKECEHLKGSQYKTFNIAC